MFKPLEPFLPAGALPFVINLLAEENFHLIVSKPRKTKLGDFRPPQKGKPARITVNGNLNEYAFLVTLVHEIAHLKIWNEHKNKVNPHGKEWKKCYAELLHRFTKKDIFPDVLELAIEKHIKNPKYSSCTDAELTTTLRQFDDQPNGVLLRDLPAGTVFKMQARLFRVDEKLRTRFLCTDLKNHLKYRIHGLAEVEPVNSAKLA